MVTMMRSDYIKWIFQDYLYFLSKSDVDHLLRLCRDDCDENFVLLINHLLVIDADALINIINSPGDCEQVVMCADVFLWRQKVGEIEQNLRFGCKFLKRYHRWLLDRYMVSNGYEGIDAIPVESTDGVTSCRDEINSYLDKQAIGETAAEDDFTYFITNLNIIGPTIKSHPRYCEIRQYHEFIKEHYEDDSRIKWIDPGCYAMLVSDLNDVSDATWKVYEYLIIYGHKDFVGFIESFIGIKMFGDKCLELLATSVKPIFGGYDFIVNLPKR